MKATENKSKSEAWGEFRFSVVGALLASPPEAGELKGELGRLSERTWKHPITGNPFSISVSTIEKWYYAGRASPKSPMIVLKQKVRSDRGRARAVSSRSIDILLSQYRAHPSWSYQLHADNLKVSLEKEGLRIPSYSTICRYMHRSGMRRCGSSNASNRVNFRKALGRVESFEVRSFESDYVGSLFHLDFHHCSRQVLNAKGEWVTPILLTIMDDCSRLICHLQWYLAEGTEELVHGVSQAFLKVGLPRALMSDNGSAMISAEFTRGLSSLGIVHSTTLPYSPYQNGKLERVHQLIEGRLMAMLEGEKDLTLKRLNDVTSAWYQVEYHYAFNKEMGQSPRERYIETKSVLREVDTGHSLRCAFRRRVRRTQRRSDGTISLHGRRFEIPGTHRDLKNIFVEYAEWDLSLVHAVDEQNGALLCPLYPVDKSSNASGERRRVKPTPPEPSAPCEEPALLTKILTEFAATGLPASFIPKDE